MRLARTAFRQLPTKIRTFRRCIVHDRLCPNRARKTPLRAGTHLALNAVDLR